jgi:hypothetical protein
LLTVGYGGEEKEIEMRSGTMAAALLLLSTSSYAQGNYKVVDGRRSIGGVDYGPVHTAANGMGRSRAHNVKRAGVVLRAAQQWVTHPRQSWQRMAKAQSVLRRTSHRKATRWMNALLAPGVHAMGPKDGEIGPLGTACRNQPLKRAALKKFGLRKRAINMLFSNNVLGKGDHTSPQWLVGLQAKLLTGWQPTKWEYDHWTSQIGTFKGQPGRNRDPIANGVLSQLKRFETNWYK